MPIDETQLRRLISETLSEVGLHSESAVELIMLTFAVESNLGDYIDQTNGPAIGLGQMEPATYDDIYASWFRYRPDGFKEVIARFVNRYVGTQRDSRTMRYNLKYAILMTRLHYLRVKAPLPPNDPIQLAQYWKRFYNTELGKGTVDKAVKKYLRYCTDNT